MVEAQKIENIPNTAIIIFIAVITIAIGASILDTIQTGQTNSVVSFGNETLTWAGNNTAIKLGADDLVSGSELLYSNAVLIGSGNYSINYAGGSITPLNISNSSVVTWVTSDLNISYNYYIGSTARNATGFGLTGLSTFASYVPTIALVVVAVLIIGITLGMFRRKT